MQKKKKQLTQKQRNFIRALPRSSTVKQAALKAGYSNKNPDQSGHQVLKALEGQVSNLLERNGLTDDAVIKKYLVPLMNAKEIKAHQYEGSYVYSKPLIAWGPRAEGLRAFSLIRGWNKTEQENSGGGVKIVVINQAHRPDIVQAVTVPPMLPPEAPPE